MKRAMILLVLMLSGCGTICRQYDCTVSLNGECLQKSYRNMITGERE